MEASQESSTVFVFGKNSGSNRKGMDSHSTHVFGKWMLHRITWCPQIDWFPLHVLGLQINRGNVDFKVKKLFNRLDYLRV